METSHRTGKILKNSYRGFWHARTESGDKFDMVKIGIMLSHAGKEAREVYKTLQWNEEGDNQKFNKATEVFRQYCSPRKHILYKQYTFWMLQQEAEESVDAYLTRIKLKLDMCEYAAEVHQELTRDKFVFGLTDNRLKERLFCEENLDLTQQYGKRKGLNPQNNESEKCAIVPR